MTVQTRVAQPLDRDHQGIHSSAYANAANPTVLSSMEKTVYTFFKKLTCHRRVRSSDGRKAYCDLPVPEQPDVGSEANILTGNRAYALAGAQFRLSKVEAMTPGKPHHACMHP